MARRWTLDVLAQAPGARAGSRGLGCSPAYAGAPARPHWTSDRSGVLNRSVALGCDERGLEPSKLRSIGSLWGTWCFGRTLLIVRQVRGRPGVDSLRVWPQRKCHYGKEQEGNCADNRDDWAGNLGPLTNWRAAPPHLLGLSTQVLGIATAAPAVCSKL